MLKRALNHMAAPNLEWQGFVALAASLNCVGVEFRNDLGRDLFEGATPEDVGAACSARGLKILALAEVKAFDDWSDEKQAEAASLMTIARACGAERISLIARNDGINTGKSERNAALKVALDALAPMLAKNNLIGLIEPLGFESCALRYKDEVVEAIHLLGSDAPFQIVHDTFHHALAGGGALFPNETGIVHVSGVTKTGIAVTDFQDPDRELVTSGDRLGNIEQVAELLRKGYDGAISFEPFSPQVHGLAHPRSAYEASFAFMEAGLADPYPA
ncbi:TIM barrel protein [Primorskyibacter flagellatus]|uniref:2-keto-myo-inositol isomerase n=1 Tax=Primorskyibacter flagellatus TaxID=1387277 RepID=A0A1W2EB30_9RHOB|nr:TIM barrel protein [Primorskyibacter flagellatus]SMD06546.1 2-keto-myo-inositol isomerase [Primorskyibacter flagellatus]